MKVVKGEVFAYDGSSKSLVLLEPLPGVPEKTNVQETEHHVRLLNANYIKKVISAEQVSLSYPGPPTTNTHTQSLLEALCSPLPLLFGVRS